MRNYFNAIKELPNHRLLIKSKPDGPELKLGEWVDVVHEGRIYDMYVEQLSLDGHAVVTSQ